MKETAQISHTEHVMQTKVHKGLCTSLKYEQCDVDELHGWCKTVQLCKTERMCITKRL